MRIPPDRVIYLNNWLTVDGQIIGCSLFGGSMTLMWIFKDSNIQSRHNLHLYDCCLWIICKLSMTGLETWLPVCYHAFCYDGHGLFPLILQARPHLNVFFYKLPWPWYLLIAIGQQNSNVNKSINYFIHFLRLTSF